MIVNELIQKIVQDYIQQYIARTGKNPTSDLVSNMVGMVKRDIKSAQEQGITYEQMYANAFKSNAQEGILNSQARAGGQAYELMSTPGMRSAAVGAMNGPGRGQINPPVANPNVYPDVGGGRGRTGTQGGYYSDPRQWPGFTGGR